MVICAIIVGSKGTGKSSWIKNQISVVNSNALMVYDINNEYSSFYPYPFLDFKVFTEKACNVSDAVIVFEEATIFLNARGYNNKVINILVRARHTNNSIFLVFHSINSIPKYLFELCNKTVLFKTNDNPDTVLRKFGRPDLYASFMKLRENPPPKDFWNHYEIIDN